MIQNNSKRKGRYKKFYNDWSIWQDISDRWNSESPAFWKKIMKYSVTLGTGAASIIGFDKLFDLQNYGIPQIVFTVCGYILVACAAFGLSAKITKQNNTEN